ncbi:hypothetical protein C2869_19920 [Saccharobesus litoralis]|uniref:Uncharacterized protein n=1 Tax=Saccharobesus litoralis TaxID=2172099 RepID=A0A2S0VWD6_9ALTE|nr:hypothetical protein [Saccharobesus litoralis]AWB68528.1 hypothetical protein C2869_19920 [Saccharobesus litoralis]
MYRFAKHILLVITATVMMPVYANILHALPVAGLDAAFVSIDSVQTANLASSPQPSTIDNFRTEYASTVIREPKLTRRWQRSKQQSLDIALQTTSTFAADSQPFDKSVSLKYHLDHKAALRASFSQLQIQTAVAGKDTLFERNSMAFGADFNRVLGSAVYAGVALKQFDIYELDSQGASNQDTKALAVRLGYGFGDKLTLYSAFQVTKEEESYRQSQTDSHVDGQAVSIGALYSWSDKVGGYVEATVDETLHENLNQTPSSEREESVFIGIQINL